MPLVKFQKINHQAAWALWEIDQDLTQLRKDILSKSDNLNELAKIHHPQKRLEWLAARSAAQTLLRNFGEPFNGISKDNHGKPHFVESDFHLSLAHSFPYAVAIISCENPVGIDIEKPRAKLQRIASKFLNPSEEQEANKDLIKLCWYWAAKETLYKIYGRKNLIFKKNLAIEPFDPDFEGSIQGRVIVGPDIREYKLQFHTHEEFFICYNI